MKALIKPRKGTAAALRRTKAESLANELRSDGVVTPAVRVITGQGAGAELEARGIE